MRFSRCLLPLIFRGIVTVQKREPKQQPMNKTDITKPQEPPPSLAMPEQTPAAKPTSAVKWPAQLTPRQRLLKAAADKVMGR